MAGIEFSYLSDNTANDDYFKVLFGLNILRKGIVRYVKDQIGEFHKKMIDTCICILHQRCRHISNNIYLCDDCKNRIKDFLTTNHRNGKHDFTQTSIEKCAKDDLEVALFYCDTINTRIKKDFDSIGCNGALSLLLNVKDIERGLKLTKSTNMETFVKVKNIVPLISKF